MHMRVHILGRFLTHLFVHIHQKTKNKLEIAETKHGMKKVQNITELTTALDKYLLALYTYLRYSVSSSILSSSLEEEDLFTACRGLVSTRENNSTPKTADVLYIYVYIS